MSAVNNEHSTTTEFSCAGGAVFVERPGICEDR